MTCDCVLPMRLGASLRNTGVRETLRRIFQFWWTIRDGYCCSLGGDGYSCELAATLDNEPGRAYHAQEEFKSRAVFARFVEHHAREYAQDVKVGVLLVAQFRLLCLQVVIPGVLRLCD